MKAKVIPLRFPGTRQDGQFESQLEAMQSMFAEEAEFLPPVAIGSPMPEADAAMIFFLPAEIVYHQPELLRAVPVPILNVSPEYGARSMWDWEQFTYCRAEGVKIYAPYTKELTSVLLRTLTFKREMKGKKLLLWISDQHQGYYFWEKQCAERIYKAFGVEVVWSSFKDLNIRAMAIPDEDARREAKAHAILKEDVRGSRLLNAYKLYMAMKEEILQTEGVLGIGCACLDEPNYTTTTPCLAYNLLNRELGVSVVCEGDMISLMTEVLLKHTIGIDSFSTNIYPFLMGLAAIRHEKISSFPAVDAPEDHALLVHCGYCGMIPETISTSWILRPAILGMVSDNAVMADARIAEGDITLVKLHSDFDKWFLSPAKLEGYVQYPGSDCRNGGLIRVQDGHRFMDGLYSHHITVLPGKYVQFLKYVGELLSLKPNEK